MIQNTLSSLPIYFMSILHLPRLVKLRLEQIRRDFLWDGGPLEQKPHLVRWATICLDKRKRGLGAWGLRVLLFLIRLFFANGVDILRMRERPFGIK